MGVAGAPAGTQERVKACMAAQVTPSVVKSSTLTHSRVGYFRNANLIFRLTCNPSGGTSSQRFRSPRRRRFGHCSCQHSCMSCWGPPRIGIELPIPLNSSHRHERGLSNHRKAPKLLISDRIYGDLFPSLHVFLLVEH